MIEAVIATLMGLLVGSFLNVCIHRMPRDRSVAWPGSHCPQCGHPLRAYDNIPVLSYAILGGRCRYCRAAISWRYPAVETATAILFLLAWLTSASPLEAAKWACFSAIMLVLVMTDLETRILPDEFTLGGLIPAVVFAWLLPLEDSVVRLFVPGLDPGLCSVLDALLAAGVTSGALWLVGWLYERVRRREGLGLGDVKMVATIGAFLGLPNTLLAIFAGCVTGAVIGLLFILLCRKDAATYQLPFGSFLGAAAIAVALLGR
jgi:leader peptidase (prepilin peptidase)/N-methyltransferase